MTDEEIARRAIACLDLTDLTDSCDEADVERLCARARQAETAAVCVWPRYVKLAREMLDVSRVKVATVVNFPHGGDDPEAPVAETEAARADGVDEIDVVLPWRAFLEGREADAEAVLRAVKAAAGSRALKVILESGDIADTLRIRAASDLAIACGADFLKTSTGKTRSGATPEAAGAMLEAIREAGHPVGLKVSGGVKTLADARSYLELVGDRMGAGWAKPETFRFGASGLLATLLDALSPESPDHEAEDAPEAGDGGADY